MVEVISAFLFVAVIILVGFFGTILFNKTKISDILLLMLIGLAIGPVFHLIDLPTIDLFKTLTPLFASLALIVLLFEGGLQMNFFRVLKELSKTAIFTLIVFVLTVVFTAAIMFLLGWGILYGLLLGAIIGGTSAAIVIPLVQKTRACPEAKNLLNVESAFTDALCVIVAIAIIEIILSKNLDASRIAQNLLGAFSIAAVIGLIAGILWLKLLRDFPSIKQFQYVLTIAVLFLLYGVVEFAKGNGAIAALVFGIVLGNAKEIMQMLRLKETELDTGIRLFQNEISFFIRTFFFIYIGIIFELAITDASLIIIALALLAVILLARFIGTKILNVLDSKTNEAKSLIISVSARGLAAAVLATYPAAIGLRINGIEGQIVQITFLIILLSNIVTTAGVFLFERKIGQKEALLQQLKQQSVQK